MRSLYAILSLLGAAWPIMAISLPRGNASVALSTTSSVKVAGAKATPAAVAVAVPYWLEQIKHQGISAFNPSPGSYQVFRNVKDFGAKGTVFTCSETSPNARQGMASPMILLRFRML